MTTLRFVNRSQRYLDSIINGIPNPEEIVSVGIHQSEIKNLKCLSRLCNLERLDVTESLVSDLEPLRHLVKLVQLGLGWNSISNLEPISGLVYLEVLSLRGNQISDLQPLSGLGNLWSLDLRGNRISNLIPLKYMFGLDVLYLTGNRRATTKIINTIERNRRQYILLESTIPKNYRCPFSNLRERGILGLYGL
jgi:hypothetical protein